jgi:Glutathione-dependent formaldehyde-activating enzyme
MNLAWPNSILGNKEAKYATSKLNMLVSVYRVEHTLLLMAQQNLTWHENMFDKEWWVNGSQNVGKRAGSTGLTVKIKFKLSSQPNQRKMEGHCLCGAINVKVNDSNLFSTQRRGHLCHCRNCRRVAGGIFGTNLAIEASKVEITGIEHMKEYIDLDTTSGKPMRRCFCEHCGT